MSEEHELRAAIERGWEGRDELTPASTGPVRDAVEEVLALLDRGEVRVAERSGGSWTANAWVKQAIMLSFRLFDNELQVIGAGPPTAGLGPWWDKVHNKFSTWGESRFREAGFRAVPGAIVRFGAHVSPGAILMPSFVNVGAYVGSGTMIDTWATVGSCAQVGQNCHISGGAGLGGVLEPAQATPVIIEDGCFIGARSEVTEGVVVGEGAVLAMGVFLSQTTKIVDRATGVVTSGRVPPYSVVVPGSLAGPPLPDGSPSPSLACAVIVKTVDESTRSKTSVNELLRS